MVMTENDKSSNLYIGLNIGYSLLHQKVESMHGGKYSHICMYMR